MNNDKTNRPSRTIGCPSVSTGDSSHNCIFFDNNDSILSGFQICVCHSTVCILFRFFQFLGFQIPFFLKTDVRTREPSQSCELVPRQPPITHEDDVSKDENHVIYRKKAKFSASTKQTSEQSKSKSGSLTHHLSFFIAIYRCTLDHRRISPWLNFPSFFRPLLPALWLWVLPHSPLWVSIDNSRETDVVEAFGGPRTKFWISIDVV